MWQGAFNHFGISDVTDNQSNSYTMDREDQDATDRLANAAIYSDVDIGSPSGTFTITLNPAGTNNTYVEWIAVEFSGLLDISVLDKVNSANGTNSNPTVTSAATTQADELVLGCLGVTGSASLGIDLPAGYSQLYLHDSSSDTVGHLSAYKIVSATGAQTFDGGTVAGALPRWAICVATYKGTGGAPAIIDTGAIMKPKYRPRPFAPGIAR
jgi:hypothetical protein